MYLLFKVELALYDLILLKEIGVVLDPCISDVWNINLETFDRWFNGWGVLNPNTESKERSIQRA